MEGTASHKNKSNLFLLNKLFNNSEQNPNPQNSLYSIQIGREIKAVLSKDNL